LRTVATTNATSSEHTLNPQTPRVKREPLLRIREKTRHVSWLRQGIQCIICICPNMSELWYRMIQGIHNRIQRRGPNLWSRQHPLTVACQAAAASLTHCTEKSEVWASKQPVDPVDPVESMDPVAWKSCLFGWDLPWESLECKAQGQMCQRCQVLLSKRTRVRLPSSLSESPDLRNLH
jgi:hypothetical protein